MIPTEPNVYIVCLWDGFQRSTHVDMSEKLAMKEPGPLSKEVQERVDWKKWKEGRKEEKRRRKEEKLITQMEKQKMKELKEKKAQAEKEEKSNGRSYTLSVALPGSVLDNAQSPELRTYLAGQIARACTVFCVDEIVVFEEQGEDVKNTEGEYKGVGKKGRACVQLARILQYLECPQYLRKAFFPKHQDLQFAGLLNPLDSPHHMRMDEGAEFREGLVLDRPCKAEKGSYVDCGMRKEVRIDKQLQPGLRVTVKLHKDQESGSKCYKGLVVAPHVPRTEKGLYWGYTVRLASCLSGVFTECPFKEGYDITIGTSEKGNNADNVTISPFRHMLVVFGGLSGLEASVETDDNLDVSDPSSLFNLYLNTCPSQGSRTIRTEEAILISLSALRQKITTVFPSSSD
ncbi:putative methyltransferase C9orf114 homolog isoform X1 [Clupea harengus]|uniref:28S rRNA (uridine-N(3))-methyltransferase n=1 Tax=Clupea harengus TaxID=7950 RepID=A0A6P8G2C9_CLUHA|nr:putative methyltransferase C9orf114 homolog isoform X1 [Clupea harengus]